MALGGGLSGAAAMVLQVFAFMVRCSLYNSLTTGNSNHAVKSLFVP